MENIAEFNTNYYSFELVNNNTKIKVFHTYGSNRKFAIQTAIKINNIQDTTLKKAIRKLKKYIREEKAFLEPLENCTCYLDAINL